MTANVDHVAAVETAMDVDIAGYCERKHNNPPNNKRMATVAIETLTPLVRAQVAAEIRAEYDKVHARYESWLHTYGSAVEPGSRDHDSEIMMDALDLAARIASKETDA